MVLYGNRPLTCLLVYLVRLRHIRLGCAHGCCGSSFSKSSFVVISVNFYIVTHPTMWLCALIIIWFYPDFKDILSWGKVDWINITLVDKFEFDPFSHISSFIPLKFLVVIFGLYEMRKLHLFACLKSSLITRLWLSFNLEAYQMRNQLTLGRR